MKHLTSLIYLDAVSRSGSVRSAAEELAITSSALNRRIQALEAEIGVELFERHSNGMRLNTAGEIFLDYARRQISDLEQVKSRIADLTGRRAGHIRIAATHEVAHHLLPHHIASYRSEYPDVTFDVQIMRRGNTERALLDYSADIALVVEPTRLADFQISLTVDQHPLCIVDESHPLAGRNSLRLYECLEYGWLMPGANDGIRDLLEKAVLKSRLAIKRLVEANDFETLCSLTRNSQNMTFTLPVAIGETGIGPGLKAIPIDQRDISAARLFIGHLQGRAMSVAAERFVEQIVHDIGDKYGE